MKIKWHGLDIELTVDELEDMYSRGLIDINHDVRENGEIKEKSWDELVNELTKVKSKDNLVEKNPLPKMPEIKPFQTFKQPYEPLPRDPYRDNICVAYGCGMTPTVTYEQYNQTTSGTATNSSDGPIISRLSPDKPLLPPEQSLQIIESTPEEQAKIAEGYKDLLKRMHPNEPEQPEDNK